MLVCHTLQSLHQALEQHVGKSIGFVPTMGALHQGHMSLIQTALNETNLVVCSVFVNPTQFNNPNDLKAYPRTLDKDSSELEQNGCHILFAPSISEVYPNTLDVSTVDVNFGSLTQVMEARFRPGHFNGVIAVVRRLFEIVKPNRAYFGEKDFQQLCIVRQLTQNEGLGIEIVGCPIIREADGLAMSSRNMNLSEIERKAAASIPKLLAEAIEYYKVHGLTLTKIWIAQQLIGHSILKLEYFDVADTRKLESLEVFCKEPSRAFIVVYAGKTRLIDNMPIASH